MDTDDRGLDRRRVLSLSGALAAAALAGCTTGGDTGGDSTTTAGSGSDPATGTTATGEATTDGQTTTEGDPPGAREVPEDIDSEALSTLAEDNAAFATDLHRHLASTEGGNQFVSPYSISVSLAMTYAGARGRTREEMAEALHYSLGEEIHPGFSELESALESRGETDGVRLDVANAIWGREGVAFAESYLALLSSFYGAGLRRADFAGDPEGERQRINEWVAERTEGKITDLMGEGSVTPDTALVLVNAIYLLADWARAFDPENTSDGTFTALDGSESTVPFMSRPESTHAYASLEDLQAVELPYAGEDLSMVVIVPDAGAFETVEARLDAETLFDVFDALSETEVALELPTFEFRSKFRLREALSALGMPTAFTRSADFDGMVEGDGPPLSIDDVHHEAYVAVDEEGTEAAAATGTGMQVTCACPTDRLRVDRPFLFCIRDRPTDAVLFLGRVVDAGETQSDGGDYSRS